MINRQSVVRAWWGTVGRRTQRPQHQTPDIAEYLREEQAAILRYLPSTGMDLLEVGCGEGRVVHQLVAARPEVRITAIDYVPDLVEALERRPLPGVTARCVDATQLPSEWTGAFDVVLFAFNTLGNLQPPDDVRALDQAKRVLRPGGVILISAYRDSEAAASAQRDLYTAVGWELEDAQRGFRLGNAITSRRFGQAELLRYFLGDTAYEAACVPLASIAWLLAARKKTHP